MGEDGADAPAVEEEATAATIDTAGVAVEEGE